MTNTTPIEDVLRRLDAQLLSPLANSVTLSRDDAAHLIEVLSEESLLKVWTAGFCSGQVSTMVSALDNPQEWQVRSCPRLVADRASRLWADPIAREQALVSVRSVFDHRGACGCGAPWH